jgi:hypothetical protein
VHVAHRRDTTAITREPNRPQTRTATVRQELVERSDQATPCRRFLPGAGRERLAVGADLIATPITALDISIHPPVMPLQPNGSDSASPGVPSTDVGMPSGRIGVRPARSVHEAEPCSSGMITDLSGLRGLRFSRRHPGFDGAEHDPAGAERNRTAPTPVKTAALTLRRSRRREIRGPCVKSAPISVKSAPSPFWHDDWRPGHP